MTSDDKTNKPATATTSTKEPPAATEAEYLDRQLAEAKAAISRVLGSIQDDLAHGADVRIWAREYPLASAGGAALAGLLAALAMVPSRQQRAIRKLAKLQKSVVETQVQPEPAPAKGGSFFSRLGREAIDAFKPAVMSAIAAGVSGRMAQAPPPPQPKETRDNVPAAEI